MIDGREAYEEDRWRIIRIGTVKSSFQALRALRDDHGGFAQRPKTPAAATIGHARAHPQGLLRHRSDARDGGQCIWAMK